MMADSERNTPEYQAISSSRRSFETQLSPHLSTIIARLRDRKLLTPYQCNAIMTSGALMEDILIAIEASPVETFVEFLHELKSIAIDSKPLTKFIGKIESKMRENYLKSLATTSGSSGRQYDVFISYAPEEESAVAFADRFAALLAARKLQVFLYHKSIVPGEESRAERANAICTCNMFIVVLTEEYTCSTHCRGELYKAESLKKPFFPVKLEERWDEEELAAQPIKDILRETQCASLSGSWEEAKLKEFAEIIVKKIKPSSEDDVDSGTSPDSVTLVAGATETAQKTPANTATASSAQPSFFDSLAKRYDLSSHHFNKEVSDMEILDIYPQLENWQVVASHLDLTKADIQGLKYNQGDEKVIKMHMLQKWRSQGLIFGTATYRVLIEAQRKAECHNNIAIVCKVLKKNVMEKA